MKAFRQIFKTGIKVMDNQLEDFKVEENIKYESYSIHRSRVEAIKIKIKYQGVLASKKRKGTVDLTLSWEGVYNEINIVEFVHEGDLKVNPDYIENLIKAKIIKGGY